METASSTDLDPMDQPQADLIPVGISSCILGAEVRFNGGHKLDRFVRDTLGAYLRFVPVCPEVDIGLGIPRETLRLIQGESGSVRMVAPKSGSDHTDAMEAYAKSKTEELASQALCGFIVQKGSPSCGMERVRVYGEPNQAPARNGRGLFTQALMDRFPNLPVEEDGRLNDPGLRENFIERIFAYRRIRALFSASWTIGDLVAFHTREKFLVLAHSRTCYDELGRLVAGAKSLPPDEVATEYERLFLSGLKEKATRGRQTNVLMHLAGHFKKVLDEGDRRELVEIIENYHKGLAPLVVPITLLRHHVRRQGLAYLEQQTYLDPHPQELMLRNHG